MKHKLITSADLCLIVLVVLISIATMFFYVFSDEGRKAVVTVNNEIICELDLDTNQTKQIETDHGFNTVVVENNECFVKNADCRDGICVKHSAISKTGQSIVCLPHNELHSRD